MAGPGSIDQISDIWWIAWAQFALAHGHDPFFSTWQNAPIGVNVVANTSMLGLGVVISPITTIFGPIVAWNVLEVTALVLSATSMCAVLRRWTTWWPAAFFGGLLYGFSVYETTSIPHLNVAFAALPPLFFLVLYEILVRQQWPAIRTGALLGLICGFQYLVSSELLASMVLLGGLATVLFLLANRRNLASMFAYAIRAGVVALVVGLILLAGPVLYTLFGSEHLDGVPNSPANLALLHGDLLATFVPGYFQWFNLHSLLAGYQINSAGMYLGLPFILAVGLVVLLLRRRGIVVMAGVLAASSFVLSLGSTLYVGGHDTHVPLPFAVLAHMPIIDGLLSTRFALYTALFGAGVVALGLDTVYARVANSGVSSGRSRWLTGVIAVGVTLALGVVVSVPLLPTSGQSATRTKVPSFFSSSVLAHDVPLGSTALAYPYPDAPVFPGSTFGFSYSPRYQAVNDAFLDQAEAGMRFKLIGGYAWIPEDSYNSIGPSLLTPTSVKDLFDFAFYGVTTRPGQGEALTTGHLTVDIRLFLKRYHVATVIVLPVGRAPSIVTKAFTAALGAPNYFGGVAEWSAVQHLLTTVSPAVYRFTGPPPVTKLVRPTAGAQVGGTQYLVANASAALGIKTVALDLSSQGSAETEICRTVRFKFGWICAWNTATVPNGIYTLRSVATDTSGQVTRSRGETVHVRN